MTFNGASRRNSRRTPFRGHRRYSGLTLVELMVVIGIAVILLAVAAPLFRNGVEDQKLREAGRLVQGYFAQAQARAAQTQRPVGVWIQRLDPNSPISSMQSVQLYMAAVPPPYTGDIADAVCELVDMNHGMGLDGAWGRRNVDDNNNGSNDDPLERGWPGSDDGDGMPETAVFDVINGASVSALARPGDFIRFNYRGPFYRIANINQNFAPFTDVVFAHPQTRWGVGVNGVFNGPGVYGSDDVWLSPPAPQSSRTLANFQIYRRPERSLAPPLQLPNGLSIDLSASGLGVNGNEFAAVSPQILSQPILIMFHPSGGVANVYIGGAPNTPQRSIHLLIGPNELINPADPADLANTLTNVCSWDDTDGDQVFDDSEEPLANLLTGGSCSWVSIGHQSGLISVVENAYVRPNNATLPTQPQIVADAISQARRIAVTAQSIGGR